MKNSSLRFKIIFAASIIVLSIFSTVQAQEPSRPEPPPPPKEEPRPEMPKIIRKSGGVLQGSATRRVEPTYPPLARAAQVSGAVVVEVTLDEEGNVISARAISGHPLLKDAAVAAARGWRFSPTQLSGVPVKVIGTLTFNFSLGDSKEIEALVEEVRANPSSAQAHYNLARAYAKGSQIEEALEAFKRAIQIDPNFAEAHNGLGEAYYKLGDYEQAIASFKQALTLNPNLGINYHYLGSSYRNLGQLNEAIASFKQAVQDNPRHWNTYLDLAVTYNDVGDYNKAVEALKQVIELNPEFPLAHLMLGQTYLKLGDKESAMSVYNTLKNIEPKIAERLLREINK